MLEACGVRPHSFLQWYWKWKPCLDLTVLQFPGAINMFLVFHSTIYYKEVRVGVKLTGNTHAHTQTHTHIRHADWNSHTQKFIHKVQESAVEQLLEQCFPKASVWSVCASPCPCVTTSCPRCSHLLSIQSLAGTILSFQFSPLTWGCLYLYFYLHTASSSQCAGQQCKIPCLSSGNTN